MDVTCGSCDRKFHLDSDRVADLSAARCLCGARIGLRPTGKEPRRLGKYLLFRRIAMGGMGEIYYGKIAGVEGFEREVAIKKMLPHLSADQNFIQMIVKEAKLTVLLNHPNIVQVYDLAKEGKEYYIAMEYVPGINVGTLLETCRKSGMLLPAGVAIHITLNVLKGLAYAHDLKSSDGQPMGILHRDVTPQNILATRAGWIKITDFGIAKARNEISTTGPGMIKGKLGYIAPEQLTGQAVDQRVDIFCSGILLWETLACRRLFKGASEIDTFRLISEAKVPSLDSVRDDVKPEVEAVIRKALARDRDQRYHACRAFYDDLSQANFPATADDSLSACQAFFEENPQLFASLEENDDDDETGAPVPIDLSEEQSLIDIESLVAIEPPAITTAAGEGATPASGISATAQRRSVAPLIVIVILLGVGGFGAWRYRARLSRVLPLPSEPAAAGSGMPPKGGLSAEEVQLGVDSARARIIGCYRQTSSRELRRLGPLEATLVIPSTGGVAQVKLDPQPTGRVAGCLDGVLRKLAFRAHSLANFEATANLPEPPTTRSSPSSGGGTDSRPKSLTSAEIQGTIAKHSGGIVKCLRSLQTASAPSEVRPTIRIDTSGRVTSVVIKPDLHDAQARACLTRVLESIRFRKHPENLAPIIIPLEIKKS